MCLLFYASNGLFRMLTAFEACVSTITLPEQCPEDYLKISLEEHSSYIPTVIDGFDPVKCRSKLFSWRNVLNRSI